MKGDEVMTTASRWRLRRALGRGLSALLVGCGAVQVLATTIVPIPDRELLARAHVVVHGVVVSSQALPTLSGGVETVSVIRPYEVLKGKVSGDLVLHQLGGHLPDGRFFQLWGRPEYVPGHEVVVFAIERPEGDYQTAELLLGMFDVMTDTRGVKFATSQLRLPAQEGIVIARRDRADDADSREIELLEAADMVAPKPLAAFLAMLRGGRSVVLRTHPSGALLPVVHWEYLSATPEWSNLNNTLYRWQDFSTAQWKTMNTANITGGGSAQVLAAIDTWNNDPTSSIWYQISGPSSPSVIDLNAMSSPCGWSTCLSGGGVIGCGGPQGISGSHSWRGETYWTISTGQVWLRSFCTLDLFSAQTVQAVLAHELGHSLGLGHSGEQNPAQTVISPHDACIGDEGSALMFWLSSGNPNLGTDDQDAIRWIYGDGGNHCTTLTINSLIAQPSAPQLTGVPMTWTASASAGTAPLQYKFWRYSAATGWVMVQDYSTTNTYSWTPSASGQYDIAVWVKSAGSANTFDVTKDTGFFNITANVSVSALTPSLSLPRPTGTPITWTASASGSPAPLQYRFWRYSAATGWVIVQDYSTANTYMWTPSTAGQYDIAVWVKSAGSGNAYEATLDTGFFTITSTVNISALTPSPTPPQSAGTPITWTAMANGNPAPLQYRFWRYSAGTGWVIVQDYSTTNTFTWLTTAGTWDIAVWVKTAGSGNAFDGVLDTGTFTITP
jgi:hypothetical protein